MPRSNDTRTPYSLGRSTSDSLQAAASLLRFVDDPARTVQPGQGRRGEHGVIASGRVIPTDASSSQPSSSSQGDVNVPSVPMPSSPPRTSPRPPTPVRRVLRRRVGVMLPTRMLKPAGVGREDRPAVITRLLKESRTIRSEAPTGCHVSPKRDDIFQWVAVLEGPPGTVYEGGTFFCNIHFSMNYPTLAPKVDFSTRIYHCNVNAQGEVCIDILNEKWESTMTVRTVMMALMSLMYSCNPDEALVPSIAKQYRENRADFDKMARIWTYRYAT
ncbi:hypothetical protein V3C99_004955 [Haemonchus contortus]|uniref:UBC core domain-containing protein n=1 Tax=Haemonchus contortus TaxID=6289 RepID=A0A7I4XVN4_HAECO